MSITNKLILAAFGTLLCVTAIYLTHSSSGDSPTEILPQNLGNNWEEVYPGLDVLYATGIESVKLADQLLVKYPNNYGLMDHEAEIRGGIASEYLFTQRGNLSGPFTLVNIQLFSEESIKESIRLCDQSSNECLQNGRARLEIFHSQKNALATKQNYSGYTLHVFGEQQWLVTDPSCTVDGCVREYINFFGDTRVNVRGWVGNWARLNDMDNLFSTLRFEKYNE